MCYLCPLSSWYYSNHFLKQKKNKSRVISAIKHLCCCVVDFSHYQFSLTEGDEVEIISNSFSSAFWTCFYQ